MVSADAENVAGTVGDDEHGSFLRKILCIVQEEAGRLAAVSISIGLRPSFRSSRKRLTKTSHARFHKSGLARR
jgi:hypothetical protein